MDAENNAQFKLESSATASERKKLLAHARHTWIMDTLVQSGSVSVTKAAEALGVSEMTVRRDLKELETEGELSRAHGGAILNEKRLERNAKAKPDSDMADMEEPSFQARLSQNGVAKRKIAEEAVATMRGERTVALDVGTTTFLMSQMLADQSKIKFFTNSVRNATALGKGVAEVYLPGGRLRNDEMSVSDPMAISQFQNFWFDIAFIGVSGLTENGIYDYSFDDTEMKRVYLSRATRKVVLCDASKFNTMSLVHVAALDEFDALITDEQPPDDLAKALDASKVKIIVTQ